MKRTERHHLKENELQVWAHRAVEAFEAHRRETAWTLAAVVIVGTIALGIVVWRQSGSNRAQALLADAMTVTNARIGAPIAPGTPGADLSFPTESERAKAALAKFKAIAEAYPATDTGIFARYQEAALQMTLGNPTAAVSAYQQVVDRAGTSVYGQMARLGLAEAQSRMGRYDQAIATFKELAQLKDGPLPVDGILLQLGRTYRDAGKAADAQQTFNRLVEEYPDSPFNEEAKRELDALKKT